MMATPWCSSSGPIRCLWTSRSVQAVVQRLLEAGADVDADVDALTGPRNCEQRTGGSRLKECLQQRDFDPAIVVAVVLLGWDGQTERWCECGRQFTDVKVSARGWRCCGIGIATGEIVHWLDGALNTESLAEMAALSEQHKSCSYLIFVCSRYSRAHITSSSYGGFK